MVMMVVMMVMMNASPQTQSQRQQYSLKLAQYSMWRELGCLGPGRCALPGPFHRVVVGHVTHLQRLHHGLRRGWRRRRSIALHHHMMSQQRDYHRVAGSLLHPSRYSTPPHDVHSLRSTS